MVKMLQVPVVRGRGAGGVEGERNPQSYLVSDNYYRPDLTKAALARLSAVRRSLKLRSPARRRGTGRLTNMKAFVGPPKPGQPRALIQRISDVDGHTNANP
ncbi:hypothetical protein HPP92_022106 [Vanilla planifolia]|uniref:Uncharacterized protein n=1 Tax=Vanilla planifolia TaxID=51239 RepID=A0A835UF44_VANPL|nr:hypothetical protein HPP92_022106 [Vanilla planifolia]